MFKHGDYVKVNPIANSEELLINWHYDYGKFQRLEENYENKIKAVILNTGGFWWVAPESLELSSEREYHNNYVKYFYKKA